MFSKSIHINTNFLILLVFTSSGLNNFMNHSVDLTAFLAIGSSKPAYSLIKSISFSELEIHPLYKEIGNLSIAQKITTIIAIIN